MKNWSNKLFTGLILGILCPPLAFYFFSLIEYRGESAIELIKGFAGRKVLTHVISLSVLINLPLFFTFLSSNRDYTARGIIGATLIYAFVILILKLF